jgi:hypothetical protein
MAIPKKIDEQKKTPNSKILFLNSKIRIANEILEIMNKRSGEFIAFSF